MTKKFGKLVPLVGSFLYRNQITLCAGGPYAGKSRLSMYLSNALALGSESFLGKYAPMKVLYCSERDWDFNSAQLLTIDITEIPDTLHFFCVPDIPPKEVVEFDLDPLTYIAKTEFSPTWAPSLVVLDTAPHFQPVRAGMGEPVNSYSFNRKELLRTKRWATIHNTGVLANYHSPKQNERTTYTDPFDRILGSTAILASSVAACILERIDDKEVLVHFRSHVSVMQTPISLNPTDFTDTKRIMPELTDLESRVLALVPPEFVPLPGFVQTAKDTLDKGREHIYRVVANLIKKGWIDVKVHPASDERSIRKRVAS